MTDLSGPAASAGRAYLRIATEEVVIQDNLPVPPAELKAFFQTNAERVFGL